MVLNYGNPAGHRYSPGAPNSPNHSETGRPTLRVRMGRQGGPMASTIRIKERPKGAHITDSLIKCKIGHVYVSISVPCFKCKAADAFRQPLNVRIGSAVYTIQQGFPDPSSHSRRIYMANNAVTPTVTPPTTAEITGAVPGAPVLYLHSQAHSLAPSRLLLAAAYAAHLLSLQFPDTQ